MAFKFVCLGHNGIPRWEENRPNRRGASGTFCFFWSGRNDDEVVYVIYVCNIYIYIRIYIISLELTANAPEHGWLEDFSFPVGGLFSGANMLVLGSVYIFFIFQECGSWIQKEVGCFKSEVAPK